jgi:hypothetical protein
MREDERSVIRTKRERMTPGEGELPCCLLLVSTKISASSVRREEKKPIGTSVLQFSAQRGVTVEV